jgi:S-adenosylmethionine-diacylglycerol 3-amino-3-carboxypropyl transferase
MRTKDLLENAVINSTSASKKGVLDRLFTIWFDRLVYPQIWEDPRVDQKALQIDENSHIFTIASGSCNIFNYLALEPAKITAVDLNEAHIALFYLKKAAIIHLNYEQFFDFFGHADKKSNVEVYDKMLKPNLDTKTIEYWEGRDRFKKSRRIEYFSKGFYKYGLLGEFIGFGHKMSKLLGGSLSKVMRAKNIEEQKELFEKYVAPVFDKKLVQFLSNNAVTLYSLGIPPSQYDKMMEESGGKMSELLKERMRKLACDFDLSDNYFAWQAFGRCYDTERRVALPDYLKEENFQKLKENTHKCFIRHTSMTDFLRDEDAYSYDKYILLDAQDWMDEAALNELWGEIDRTAKDGAKVIFRTAGAADILEGVLADEITSRWSSDKELGATLTKEDRSAIYGGFHIYTKFQ